MFSVLFRYKHIEYFLRDYLKKEEENVLLSDQRKIKIKSFLKAAYY